MREIQTPIGSLFACAGENGLTRLDYHNADIPNGSTQILDQVEHELKEYFEGRLTAFKTPIDPQGTDFQKTVWAELTKIRYGETITYSKLSERIGNPLAIRAIAAANGANLLSIIVPCHRVIASNGEMQGYRGGINAKRFLIDHERGQAKLF